MSNPETPQTDTQPVRVRARGLYLISALVSLAFLAGIGVIWYRIQNVPPPIRAGDTAVTTQDQVARYMSANTPPTHGGVPPIYIPTGIVLQSTEFKGPYTLQVSGYIWQKYADTLPQDLQRGVLLPEAEATTFTKVYQSHQGDEELIGWNFKATVREQFDYTKYPLGNNRLWIRLWALDFQRDVYLVPDLAAYTTLDPDARPGLDPGLVLENWKIEQSYFSYRQNLYNSNFGINGYVATQSQPELYFNVAIERNVLRVIISRLLAPLVILVQLFVIVLVIGTDNKRLEQFGVRPGAVIFTCAAFFFAVLLAQNSLRDEIQSGGVVYLESVHLITYFVIMGVAANSVLLVAQPDARLFKDNDNLWVEVLYWPLILGTMFVITLLTFW